MKVQFNLLFISFIIFSLLMYDASQMEPYSVFALAANKNNTQVINDTVANYSALSNFSLGQQANLSSIVSSGAASQSGGSGMSAKVGGDFNGDGKADLAIGVPYEDIVTGAGTVSDAGAINLIYGSSNGLSARSPIPNQFWTQDSANIEDDSDENDSFGRSLSSGDFNGDGFDDLAIGVANEDVDLAQGAGAVNVIYGSSDGLSATSSRPDQFWTQQILEGDRAQSLDHFGWCLSSGDYNGDHFDDLAIGVPDDDLGYADEAGAVNIVYGSAEGLSQEQGRADQFIAQGFLNAGDISERFDQFGSCLSSGDFNGDGFDDLGIGAPGEDLDSIPLGTSSTRSAPNAGAVSVIYGSSEGFSNLPAQFWTQESSGIEDDSQWGDFFGSSLSSGDFNGDGFDDLAIGVPGEEVDNMLSAGAVNVIYGSSDGLSATSSRPDQFWTQNSPYIHDYSEENDRFGLSLVAGDFNGDSFDDLAIGVPWQDIGIFGHNAGAVNVIYGISDGLSLKPDQFWTQDSPNIEDDSDESDDFGWCLSSGDYNGDGFDDLAIGAPFESFGDLDSIRYAGAVNVIYGTSEGLSTFKQDQFWTQNSPDIRDDSQAGDVFGFALS